MLPFKSYNTAVKQCLLKDGKTGRNLSKKRDKKGGNLLERDGKSSILLEYYTDC